MPVIRERWLGLYLVFVGLTVAAAMTTPDGISYYSGIPVAEIVCIWLFARCVWWLAGLARSREPQPLARIVECAPAAIRASALRTLPLLLLPLQLSCFLAVKRTIPDYAGFWCDGILAEIDRVLLLGSDGWTVTHALIGPLGTAFLDRIYFLWHPIVWATAIGIAMTSGTETRARFFLSWVLSWGLLGGVGAIALASAGPIFAPDLVSGFAGLLESLQAVDAQYKIGSLVTRDLLLLSYHTGDSPLISGISAAPSLHVAAAVLLVLVANRFFYWPALVFTILTFVATVHLGWHYAVDGILGAGGMLLIWKLSGECLSWIEKPRLRRPSALTPAAGEAPIPDWVPAVRSGVGRAA